MMQQQHAPSWLAKPVDDLEHATGLDPAIDTVMAAARPAVGTGQARSILGGDWLGHALHPLLTDLPLGCWLSAGLLDLVGGRGARSASRRLIGLGLLLTVPTAASGLSDWTAIEDRPTQRVGLAHAAMNGGVALAYLASWRARRKGHHLRGIALGMAGGALAVGSGYLGGHLSFTRGSGVTSEPHDRSVAAAHGQPPITDAAPDAFGAAVVSTPAFGQPV